MFKIQASQKMKWKKKAFEDSSRTVKRKFICEVFSKGRILRIH